MERMTRSMRRFTTTSSSLLHSKEYFEEIIKRFPDLDFAMAYGSGVYAQKGYSDQKSPTIDMIFATSDAESWHKENLRRHASHYAQPMRMLGAKSITRLQRSGGANVYYHPFVDLGDGNQLKYGVISTQDLEKDLREWSTMFVAGRMHKPTLTVKTTEMLSKLQAENIRYALNTSILLMPREFKFDQLFLALTSLSYGGDPRFDFGAENQNKVSNIVNANREGFMSMYDNLLKSTSGLTIQGDSKGGDSTFERSMDDSHVLQLCHDIPFSLGSDTTILKLHHDGKLPKAVRSVLSTRVRKAAPGQYAKGIMTAGVFKSLVYLKDKFSKGLFSSSR